MGRAMTHLLVISILGSVIITYAAFLTIDFLVLKNFIIFNEE